MKSILVDSMRSTLDGLVILWRPSEDAAQRIMCAPSWSAARARIEAERLRERTAS